MRHEWVAVTKLQKPPRMRCSRCGMVRRWSGITENYAYYHPGYIGGRPGPCSSPAFVRGAK